MIFCAGFVLLLVVGVLPEPVPEKLKPCQFETHNFLPYNEFRECVATLPVDCKGSDDFYNTLKQYIELSGFVDYYKDPPAPFGHMKMDQVAKLEELKEKCKNGSNKYEFEYDRQADIFNLFNSFRDLHQRYTPNPCFVFNYYLPAFPYPDLDKDGYTIFKLGIINDEIMKGYESLVEAGLIKGATKEEIMKQWKERITHINGIDVIEYFKEKAGSYTYSYDTAVNMNRLWYTGFKGGANYADGLPSGNITYTFESNKTLTVSYIYWSAGGLRSNHTLANCMSKPPITKLRSSLRNETLMDFPMRKDGKNNDSVATSDRFKLNSTIIASGNFTFSIFFDKNTSEHVGVLVLNRFFSAKYINVLIGYLKMWADDGTDRVFLSKLIIDVRNNPGGSIEASNYLNSWLNWDISEPNSDLKRFRKTKEMQWIADHWDDTIAKINLTSTYTSYDPYDFSKKMDLPTMLNDLEEVVYTEPKTNLTKKYGQMTKPTTQFNKDIPLSQTQTAALSGLYQQIFDFDRVDVTIINDGQCASSCAEFMWLAKEYGTARIMTVGGLRTPAEKYVPQFHVSDGGRVKLSNETFELMRKEAEKSHLDVSALPNYLPEGTSVSFVDTIAYSFENPSLPYQFKNGVGDFHIFNYSVPQSDFVSEYPALLDKIFDVLEDRKNYTIAEKERDVKRTWAIRNGSDTECQPHNNMVYGRMWNNEANDYTGECQKLYCKRGYYYNYTTDSCKELITVESKYNDLLNSVQKCKNDLKTAEDKYNSALNDIQSECNESLRTQQDELDHSENTITATSVVAGVFGAAAVGLGAWHFAGHKKKDEEGKGDPSLVQLGGMP